MSSRAGKPATYDDLRKLPDNLVGEILEGELFASPRPAPRHSHAASAIGADLFGPFHGGSGSSRGPGGWWILYEPELWLRKDVVVPDVAGWRRERLSRLPETVGFELAPDWVCEVVSPSTARFDRTRKMRIYRREKVGDVWLVDPLARCLEVYQLAGQHWQLLETYGDDAPERVRVPPFEQVELELSRWWPDED